MSVSFDQGVRYTLDLTHATCVLLRLLVLLCLTFLFYIFLYSACISVCIYGALNDYPRGVEKTVHILLERKTICYIVTWIRASQVFVSCRYNSKRLFLWKWELCFWRKETRAHQRRNLWLVLKKLENKWSCFEWFQEDLKQFLEDYNFSPEVLGAEQIEFSLLKRCKMYIHSCNMLKSCLN